MEKRAEESELNGNENDISVMQLHNRKEWGFLCVYAPICHLCNVFYE